MPGSKTQRNDIEGLIQSFRGLLQDASCIGKLELAYDADWIDEDYKSTLRNDNVNKQGLYFIFDASETLIYVGKASGYSWIDKRMWRHEYLDYKAIYILPLSVETAFWAPALEEYLIGRLSRNPWPNNPLAGTPTSTTAYASTSARS